LKIKKNFQSKWPNYDENELKLVTSIIESGKVNYWTGTFGKLFEKKFSIFHNIKHCVSVNSGTSALECAIKALNLKKNSEIITTPRSYYTSASSIILCGHKPKFSDVSLITQNLDPKILEKNISKKRVMLPGDIQVLEPLQKHRFTGLEETRIIEFSTHHEDTDTYRDSQSGPVDLEHLKQSLNLSDWPSQSQEL